MAMAMRVANNKENEGSKAFATGNSNKGGGQAVAVAREMATRVANEHW